MNNGRFNYILRREYGDRYLPVEIEECEIVKNDFIMPHHHTEIEIHYINNGTCDYYIDGKKHSAKEGDIVYLKPDTVHSVYKSCDKLEYTTVAILPSFLYAENSGCCTEKYFKPLKQGEYEVTCVISPENSSYEQLKNYLMEIKKLIENKENLFELELKIAVLSYFLCLYKNGYIYKRSSQEKSKYKSENAICSAIDFIDQNYNRSLTVDEIADHVGISSSHFMKLFREYTHTTCISYINKCRLTKAVELLETTRFNILDIATAVGYNNISLFNRDFKKIYGTTPKEIRKNAKIQEKNGKKLQISLL